VISGTFSPNPVPKTTQSSASASSYNNVSSSTSITSSIPLVFAPIPTLGLHGVSDTLNLFNIYNKEIAQQLTLLCFDSYKKLTVS
jgi:hypothetical protein